MANLLIIKTLLKEQNISIRDFAKEIGITEQGLQKLIRENSTKVETLELIAKKLNVSISAFFPEGAEGEMYSASKQEPITVERLLSIVESQQRTIENLSRK